MTLEMLGALGMTPAAAGPCQWWEIERLYLGWRREADKTAVKIVLPVLLALGCKDVEEHDLSAMLPRRPPAPRIITTDLSSLRALVR